MAQRRDEAVVLRVQRWSESSQIVTLLGRETGLVRCVAKGALRRTKAGKAKFDGGFDLLDVGEAVMVLRPERELQQATEWELLDGHLPLRRGAGGLRGIYLGMYAAELTAGVLQELDPQPGLFDRLRRLLDRLATPQREEVALAFTLEALRAGGYLPNLDRCAKTRQPVTGGPVLFSPGLGGVVLPEAAAGVYDVMRIGYDGLRLLRGLVRLLGTGVPQRLPRLDRADTDPLHAVLAAHVRRSAGVRLRVPPFFLPGGRVAVPGGTVPA